MNPGHLNDIHVHSKTIELEIGQIWHINTCRIVIKLKGRLGGKGHQYRSLAGLAKPHIFVWCNSYPMVVQLTFELELQQTTKTGRFPWYKDFKNPHAYY